MPHGPEFRFILDGHSFRTRSFQNWVAKECVRVTIALSSHEGCCVQLECGSQSRAFLSISRSPEEQESWVFLRNVSLPVQWCFFLSILKNALKLLTLVRWITKQMSSDELNRRSLCCKRSHTR